MFLRITRVSGYRGLCGNRYRLCVTTEGRIIERKSRGVMYVHSKLQKLRLMREDHLLSPLWNSASSANKITERIGNKIKNALVSIRS